VLETRPRNSDVKAKKPSALAGKRPGQTDPLGFCDHSSEYENEFEYEQKAQAAPSGHDLASIERVGLMS
jgi:hypothetical protein